MHRILRPPFVAAWLAAGCSLSIGDTGGVYDLSQVDRPPEVIDCPRVRVQGIAQPYWVELQFVVTATGNVDRGSIRHVVSYGTRNLPPTAVIEAAIDAIGRCQFRPGRHEDRTVDVRVRHTIQVMR